MSSEFDDGHQDLSSFFQGQTRETDEYLSSPFPDLLDHTIDTLTALLETRNGITEQFIKAWINNSSKILSYWKTKGLLYTSEIAKGNVPSKPHLPITIGVESIAVLTHTFSSFTPSPSIEIVREFPVKHPVESDEVFFYFDQQKGFLTGTRCTIDTQARDHPKNLFDTRSYSVVMQYGRISTIQRFAHFSSREGDLPMLVVPVSTGGINLETLNNEYERQINRQ